jgi:predicted ABC-type ATPase
LRQILKAKKQGFQISLFYVGLEDVELHILRVAERVRKGGHFIAEEDIRRRYNRSLAHLEGALVIADRTNIIDNTQALRNILKIECGQIRYMRTEDQRSRPLVFFYLPVF